MAFHVSSKPSLWFPVIFIFLLTLKFQAFSNLLIPLLFALSFKRISIKPYVLFVVMMFSAILLVYFFFIENIVYLKRVTPQNIQDHQIIVGQVVHV